MIMSICNSAEVLSVLRLVKIAILIIKIAVPIILLVTAMISYVKTITTGELDKTNKSLVNKVIAAVAIFMVPTVISLILSLVFPNSEVSTCLANATSEGITKVRVEHTNTLINNLEQNFSIANYNIALSSAKKISDDDKKEEMIEKVKEYEEYVDLYNNIDKLSSNFDRTEYNELYSEVEAIDNDNIRNTLLEKIESLGGKLLNVDAGTYTGSSGDLSYNVYVPNGATQGMPLIMYLHGDGGGEEKLYSLVNSIYGDDFPFIIVAPIGGMWNETSGRKEVLKNICDIVCNEYSCDTTRISISGHSRGAIGTWAMVNMYPDYFYSAVPVSCRGNISASNFTHTKVMAFCGNQGDDINYYYSNMKSNVNAINSAGGNATFVELNAGHSGTPALAFTKSTLEWMIN